MSEKSRTERSIINTGTAVVELIIYNVLSFICRTVFIARLGKTYLGFSGLFSDILTLLSLAEMGFGTAIVFFMYKPAAEKDDRKVAALLGLYRKIYTGLGLGMTAVGLCLIPLLPYLIRDIPNLPELPLIYVLYLLNTTSSYFFVYKKSLLIVDQRNDVVSIISIISNLLMNVCQIVGLLLLKSYILYLVVQLLSTVIGNLMISIYVDRHYPFLKIYKKAGVDRKTRDAIVRNVKALFASKLSSALVTSTDNLLISKFVSTVVLGLYSNYTLFTTMLRTVLTRLFDAITGSVGNLTATEKPEKIYATFRKVWFVNFWLVGFSCSCIYILINPFIRIWLGESFLLEGNVTFIISLNLYMRLMRNTFLTFTDTYGLFVELKPKCIAEAVINLVVSLFFVLPCHMGIYGVLLGTFVSNITTNFWYEPYLIYVKKFGVPWLVFLRTFVGYTMTAGVGIIAVKALAHFTCVFGRVPNFILMMAECLVVINAVYALFYGRTEEMRFFRETLRRYLTARGHSEGKN